MPTYNVTPPPLTGQGVFGMVPGTTSLPNPAGDLAGQIPGLAGTNKAATDVINSKLGGSISPGTMRALQNAAATFGLSSGMPGLRPGGLALNNLFSNIAGFSENQAQQGLQDYNSFVPTVSRTQTVDPGLQAKIADSNAVNLAAPNPSAAGSHAEQLFNKYLTSLRGGGGPGGGTRGGGGGGGGATDALGFPVDRFMSGGAGVGPGEVSGNSFSSTLSRSGGWGLGNASTPFNSNTGAGWSDQFGSGGDGSNVPPGTFTTGQSSTYDPYSQFGTGGGFGNDLAQGGGGGGLPDFFSEEYL